jgi:hypothetical protein
MPRNLADYLAVVDDEAGFHMSSRAFDEFI